ncbi:MAG: helix-turn-helix transcriptional regulator, partial [Lentilitoribacter sp.]
ILTHVSIMLCEAPGLRDMALNIGSHLTHERTSMSAQLENPAELRNMFGENLRTLAKDFPSISELSRQLGINRTQFNRYLSGESFPRPDVLARICHFFKVDARVLLEDVQKIQATPSTISSGFLADFLGIGAQSLSEETFPTGFYRFSRRSFMETQKFVIGLVYVKREGSNTFIRGYEAKAAMLSQGLQANSFSREFRGMVLEQDEGVAALVSRRNSMTSSFNYLHRVPSFENNFWVGYTTRTVRESSAGDRATRLVYEHLGSDLSKARETSKSTGYCDIDELNPFHRKWLQTEDRFK